MTRRYPIPRPADDPRFTLGLMLDVARVLAQHGYPDMTTPYPGAGGDLLDLQTALFRFLYTTPAADRPCSDSPEGGHLA